MFFFFNDYSKSPKGYEASLWSRFTVYITPLFVDKSYIEWIFLLESMKIDKSSIRQAGLGTRLSSTSSSKQIKSLSSSVKLSQVVWHASRSISVPEGCDQAIFSVSV